MFWLIRDYCARILTSRIKLLHLTGRPCSAPTERKTRGGGLFISMMLGAKMQSKLRINLCFYCCGLHSHDAKNALQKLYEVICSHTTKQPDLNCYCSWRFQLNIQYNPPPWNGKRSTVGLSTTLCNWPSAKPRPFVVAFVSPSWGWSEHVVAPTLSLTALPEETSTFLKNEKVISREKQTRRVYNMCLKDKDIS